MSAKDLQPLLSPRSVAVIGANPRRESVGGSIYANLRRGTLGGPLYAINHHRTPIDDQPVYGSLQELPAVPELAIICTPAETIPPLARECGQLGVRGLIVVSAGFRETGDAGRRLEEQLRAAVLESPHMHMIGPNCLGVVRPIAGLNASFSPVMPKSGRLALLTQSGALGTAIMDWAQPRQIGFSACVSVGNMLDVDFADLIQFFAADVHTDALLLYLEGVTRAEAFIRAAQACSLEKPIIAFKAGRFAESAHAAASHTGALASLDAVYDAAFRRAGIERANSIEELFDCARLLASGRHAAGPRLAIVTNAGGPGIMATDAWIARGGHLATLASETMDRLNTHLPTCWSHGNPVDVLGDACVDRFVHALDAVVADPGTDCVMVIVTPQTMTDAVGIATAVLDAQRRTDKLIVGAWLGGEAVEAGRSVLRNAQIPVYEFPEAAAQALHHFVSAGNRRARLSTKPNYWPTTTLGNLNAAGLAQWRTQLAAAPGLLDEHRTKQLLAAAGIPVTPTAQAQDIDTAVAEADRFGYPVVLKVCSSKISHKTDVGGVRLNLANAAEVREAYHAIETAVRQHCPDVAWTGVTVQPMILATRGIELLLGMKRDPRFGPVLLLGAGGVTAELAQDTALELTPLGDSEWEQLVKSLRLYPLLTGYRGRPGIHLTQLRDVVRNFAALVQRLPEVEALEINPLLATADSVIALDARLITRNIEART